jgi:hypothetical protein
MSGNWLQPRAERADVCRRCPGDAWWRSSVLIVSRRSGQVLADLELVVVVQLGDSIRLRLTNVPLRLPRSVIVNVSSSRTSSACRRDTVTSSRKTITSGERPISVRSLEGKKLSRPAATGANDERRPCREAPAGRCGSSVSSSGV